jgi:hypothetical protein
VERADERGVLGLRVGYDDVVCCDEEGVGYLALGGEGLARAGNAQDEAVGVVLSRTFYG